MLPLFFITRVAAFQGMHVPPSKQSNVWLPRSVTTRQTDADKVMPLYWYASQATQKGVNITTLQDGWSHHCAFNIFNMHNRNHSNFYAPRMSISLLTWQNKIYSIKPRCLEPPGHYLCTTEPGRPGCVISIEKAAKIVNTASAEKRLMRK